MLPMNNGPPCFDLSVVSKQHWFQNCPWMCVGDCHFHDSINNIRKIHPGIIISAAYEFQRNQHEEDFKFYISYETWVSADLECSFCLTISNFIDNKNWQFFFFYHKINKTMNTNVIHIKVLPNVCMKSHEIQQYWNFPSFFLITRR